jgi:tetratricopeptide (TPR) repeat protein
MAIASKEYQDAEKLLLQAFQLTPSEASIANNLGVTALRRHDLDTAGSWFQKAADEAPYRSDILGNYGLVRWMQHRTEESYAILVKAFAHGYVSSMGHYILGMIEVEKGNYRDAVDHLKKVPAERYRYRDLYLSIALRNSGKTKAAEETYMSFLRHNPAPFAVTNIR